MAEVTLEFIARRLTQIEQKMDARFDALEARISMSQGMLTRLDSADTGIQAESSG